MMYFIAALCGAVFGATLTVCIFALLTVAYMQEEDDDDDGR